MCRKEKVLQSISLTQKKQQQRNIEIFEKFVYDSFYKEK